MRAVVRAGRAVALVCAGRDSGRLIRRSAVLAAAAFERVAAHLAGLGPVVVEPVSVAVFFKRRRSFAEVRPMKAAPRVEFLLSRPLAGPRVVRSLPMSTNRIATFVDVRSPDEVDEDLLSWLTEAYESSPS